jgi:hypothetical protein
MVKRFIGIGIVTLISLLVVSTPSFAQHSSSLTVTVGYAKADGKFSVVVKGASDTKLDMYVNDKHPTQATVNKHGWATFSNVQLAGTGKLSFTKLLKGNHGTYQRPIAYTERYTVTNGKVTFSNYVTESTVTTTKTIAYTTITEQDSSLAKGTTQVKTKGVNGTEELTYQVTWTDSQQTAKTLVSTDTVTPAVNEVVEDGIYVAPAPTPTPSCYPLSDEGTCYEPGEYCRDSDQGTTGVAGDGETITCEDNDGLRWEPS